MTIDAGQIQHMAESAKEMAETVMFASFSVPEWKVLFDIYLEHYLLPMIALAALVNLGVAVYRFSQAKVKTTAMTVDLGLHLVAALSIAVAISLKVASVAFVYGPHLFLFGIATGILKQLLSLLKNIKSLLSSEPGSESHFEFKQAIFKDCVALLTKAAIFITVLLSFVLPAAPVLLLTVSAVTATLLTASNLIWGLSLKPSKDVIKSQFGMAKNNNNSQVNTSSSFWPGAPIVRVEPDLMSNDAQADFVA